MHASHAAVPDAGSHHPLNQKIMQSHMNKLFEDKLASATHFAILHVHSMQIQVCCYKQKKRYTLHRVTNVTVDKAINRISQSYKKQVK
jgi:hypothetical protein